MSHIPASVMPHAGPHHDDDHKPAPPAPRARTTPPVPRVGGGWSLAAIAVGGVLALGAVAVAVPLLRAPPAPKRKGKGKRRARG